VSAIVESLNQLNQALEKLETAAAQQEQKALKIRQQDLFGQAAANVSGNGVKKHLVDPAILAQKLDVAIERVEQVLKEG